MVLRRLMLGAMGSACGVIAQECRSAERAIVIYLGGTHLPLAVELKAFSAIAVAYGT